MYMFIGLLPKKFWAEGGGRSEYVISIATRVFTIETRVFTIATRDHVYFLYCVVGDPLLTTSIEPTPSSIRPTSNLDPTDL